MGQPSAPSGDGYGSGDVGHDAFPTAHERGSSGAGDASAASGDRVAGGSGGGDRVSSSASGSGGGEHGEGGPHPPQGTPSDPARQPLAASGASGEERHPIAHFEPAPPLEGAGQPGAKPYVVWSSAPSGSTPHEPGRDEGS